VGAAAAAEAEALVLGAVAAAVITWSLQLLQVQAPRSPSLLETAVAAAQLELEGPVSQAA
jgi:hypothetical protein